MNKIVTAGCSLSPSDGWPSTVKDFLDSSYNHYHYGMGGGSNGIQLYLLEDHIIRYGVDTGDIFVFGLTGDLRPWGVEGQDSYNKLPHLFRDEDEYSKFTEVGSFKKSINPIDDNQRYILIQNHPLVVADLKSKKTETSKFFGNLNDPYIELQRLLFTLLMIKKAGGTVIVFRGWTGALKEKTWHRFTEHFKNNNITYTDECLVEWCLKNDYPFMDEHHPKVKYNRKFGEEILLPILSRHIN
jgi:hypothetical protein